MSYNPKTVIWNDQWQLPEFIGKQRVLIVGPASPSTGGIPSYIDNLLSSQLKEQFLLGLLDPLVVKKRFHKQESHFSLNEVKSGLRVLKAFFSTMRKLNPALVHIHTSSYWGFYEKAILLAVARTIFRKKIILHIHGGEFDLFYQKALCKGFIDRIILWANKTLIVSRKIKNELGFTEMTQVDNCVSFNDVILTTKKELLRKKYGIPNGKLVFLSVALLQERKGIYKTLKIFKDILAVRNDFVFIIAGEGPQKEKIT
ncbi:MAG: glycosyltransferase, partial [bacterium]